MYQEDNCRAAIERMAKKIMDSGMTGGRYEEARQKAVEIAEKHDREERQRRDIEAAVQRDKERMEEKKKKSR